MNFDSLWNALILEPAFRDWLNTVGTVGTKNGAMVGTERDRNWECSAGLMGGAHAPRASECLIDVRRLINCRERVSRTEFFNRIDAKQWDGSTL
jgi:hypothetical protein